MSPVASKIIGVSFVYSTVYSGGDQTKHQNPASLAFVRGIPAVTGEFPAQRNGNADNIPFDDVLNLSFLSKLIERIVCVQLVNYLDKNGLHEVFQSAYRQLNSTETTSLRVHDDIRQAVDSRGGAILVLLDLSAAFDTLDHGKLIRTLDTYCGIKGDLLK